MDVESTVQLTKTTKILDKNLLLNQFIASLGKHNVECLDVTDQHQYTRFRFCECFHLIIYKTGKISHGGSIPVLIPNFLESVNSVLLVYFIKVKFNLII